MKRGTVLALGEAPFIFARPTTSSIMWGVSLALAPALAWGVFCFGYSTLVVVGASIVGALAGEAIASGMRRRFTLVDGSAFLTGLLVGMAMPPSIGPLIPALASFFAMVVVKGAFGGLGSNWMNPALAALAFALINWPSEMKAWTAPRLLNGLSGLSGATPLAYARPTGGMAGSSLIDLVTAGGTRISALDSSVTDCLNRLLFSNLGAELPGGYIDMLVGNKSGALGELSGLLILAASIVLLARRTIRWEVPASIVASFTLLTWVFGGFPLGEGAFTGDVLFSVLSGSFLLVTFFMAPDPVTSPSSRLGMIVYGIGIGLFTFLFRSFGANPEGTAFAVILMNCLVPSLSKLDTKAQLRRAAAIARAEGQRKAVI
jgi:Na+-translocating ferredoxin:NAD+ oxidoreductase subunit D